MSPERFLVSCSKAKKAEFRRVTEEARADGRFEMAVKAGEWVLEELARTPMEFGESRGELLHLELQLRFAYVRPIAMQFAVHEPSRKVFIRSFRYRP
jgi:hypothetical protein